MSEPSQSTDPSDVDAPRPGLRERSKAKRRAAIQRAATALFAERGFEHTTLADIAEAAEVAPRTISGYFASKADLATSFSDDLATQLNATFAANPDANLLEVLDRWLRETEQFMDRELAACTEAMYQTNPALRALSSARSVEIVERSSAAFFAQTGLTTDHPIATISSAAIGAAVNSYLSVLAQHGPSEQLHESFIRYLQIMIEAAGSD